MSPPQTTWTAARGSSFQAEVRQRPLFGRRLPAELLAWAAGDERAARGERPALAPPESVRRLALALRREVTRGAGVAWLRHPLGRGLDPAASRSLFVHLGALAGRAVGSYGRLYAVSDQGGSYLEQVIPVSQTRAATGQHTDSSNRDVLPDCVALLCERTSPSGGESVLSSVRRAARNLARSRPELLGRLQRDFVRDLVTPDAVRDREHVRANRFPILTRDTTPAGWTLRYMRAWIERGHAFVGQPLGRADRAALDALDCELQRPENTVRLRLAPGDQLWIDNRALAHGRSCYEDPSGPGSRAGRLLWRQWIAFA